MRSQTRPGLWPGALIMTALLGLVSGCEPGEPVATAVPPQAEAKAATGTSAPQSRSPVIPTPRVLGDPQKFLELARKVPRDLKADPVPIAILHQRVDLALAEGRAYVRKEPRGQRNREVLVSLARLATMNLKRVVLDRMQAYREANSAGASRELRRDWKDQLLAEVIGYVDEATEMEPTKAEELELAKTRGQAYFFADRPQDAAEVYLRIRNDFPEDSDRERSWTAMITALHQSRRHAEVIVEAGKFLEANPSSKYTPYLIDVIAKSYLQSGQVEKSLAHWVQYEPLIRAAAAGQRVELKGVTLSFSPETRQDFGMYLERLDFQKGFLEYAIGRAEAAKKHFDRSIEELENRRQGGKLGQAGEVYLTRTMRVRDTIEKLAGKEAPALKVANGWVSTDPVDLTTERGNVIALYFAPYEMQRPQEFNQELQKIYQERWKDGLRAAWISMPKGRKDLDAQAERLSIDAMNLGLTFPVAMDLDPGMKLHDDYNIAKGTSTFVLVDRQGRVVWYKMDPTYRDFSLARFVIDRLLSEPGS